MPDLFRVRVEALDILGERLDLDVRQFPFDIPHLARTVAERQRIADLVLTDLQHRGLAYQGRPEPEVEEALAILACGPGMAMTQVRGGEVQQARAASNGPTAVLAVQRGPEIEFELLRPAAALGALLRTIPARPAFPGRPVTFPQDEPPGQDDAAGGILEAARPVLTGYAAQRDVAARMMALPCTSGGMVVGFAVDTRGRFRQGEPLVWRDTGRGRFAVRVTISTDRSAWSTFTPVDSDRLGQQIGEIWHQLARN